MISNFSKTLKGLAPAVESESLIKQAAEVVENKESLDPAVINQADQFEAEIERLKSKSAPAPEGGENANASTEAPADETPPGGEESSADSAPAATAEDNASGAEDKDAPRVEEGAAERAQEDALNDEQEGDLEAAADQDAVDEKKAAAVEAYHAVLDQYRRLLYVHETGTIKQVHIGLCSATVGRVSKQHNLAKPGLSLESGDGVLARVAQFIRDLIAKIKEAFSSLYNWLRDFFRGYKTATGKYEATRQAVTDRMTYLEGKGVVVTDAQLTGKTVKVPGLSNVHGNEIKDIGEAVADLSRFATALSRSLEEPALFAAAKATTSFPGLAASLGKGIVTVPVQGLPISAEAIFGRIGNLSKFGNSSFVRDNIKFVDAATRAGEWTTVRVTNLIGGVNYTWVLESDDQSANLHERTMSLRQVDFKQERNSNNEFSVQALTPEAIKAILAMADQLTKTADVLVDQMTTFSKNSDILKNASAEALNSITKFTKDGTLTEQDSFILANLSAIAPDAYIRVSVNSTAKLIAHLRSTADSLVNWTILSSKVIEEAIKNA